MIARFIMASCEGCVTWLTFGNLLKRKFVNFRQKIHMIMIVYAVGEGSLEFRPGL